MISTEAVDGRFLQSRVADPTVVFHRVRHLLLQFFYNAIPSAVPMQTGGTLWFAFDAIALVTTLLDLVAVVFQTAHSRSRCWLGS